MKKQNNFKAGRREEIIQIGMEINKIENQKTIKKINRTKSFFCEKINKIDRSLARLTKKIEIRLKLLKLKMKFGVLQWLYRNKKYYLKI